MVLYQSKRSARRSQDEWCGLRHIGLIYPEYTIINGFHFPYPLNGTQIVQCQEDFDDD